MGSGICTANYTSGLAIVCGLAMGLVAASVGWSLVDAGSRVWVVGCVGVSASPVNVGRDALAGSAPSERAPGVSMFGGGVSSS